VVRAGALVALEPMACPVEIVAEVIEMLQDPALLVQYFAGVALASMLRRVDRMCEIGIGGVIEAYFRLAREFHDCHFIDTIRVFVKFCGTQLFECAIDFVAEMYQLFLGCENAATAGIIMASVSMLIEMMGGHAEVVAQLLNEIVQTFAELLAGAKGIVVELLSNIVAFSPEIGELHWRCFELVHSFQIDCLDESFLLYRNLVLKDRRVEKVIPFVDIAFTVLADAPDVDQKCPAMSLLAVVLGVLRGTEFITDQLFGALMPMALDAFDSPRTAPYADLVLSSMLIANPEAALGIIGAKRNAVLAV
jgi:hypothetical protein